MVPAKESDQSREIVEHAQDTESGRRKLQGFCSFLVAFVAVGMSLIHFYYIFVQPADPLLLRSVHVSAIMVLGFLLWPANRRSPRGFPTLMDWVLAALAVAVVIYVFVEFEGLILRSGVSPTTADVFFSLAVVVLTIELTRRTTGPTLPIITLVFLLYTLWGGKLPGLLAHPSYSLERTMSFLFGVQGIYNIPVGVSATFVFMFILFGTILNISGGGQAMIDFAKALAGGRRGGPAKVAIIASSLFGTISGAAVANVAVTGTFTIPLMKKTGYPGYFAGAVEAVASTGGQITPPILGAAAFLMAELLGRPYSDVVRASIIPAFLFYVSLFFMVDFEAAKRGLLGLPRKELPELNEVLTSRGHLLLPILVLVYFLLAVRLSPLRSALWAAVSVVILTVLHPKTRSNMNLKLILRAIEEAPQAMVTVAATCTAAGIVIGTMSLTGLGHRFAVMLVEYSQGNILLALLLTMAVSIILGMGVPPVAAYAIAAAAIGPALIEMGIPALAAHMFIFYFCVISVITPPVALAAYAAAALAGENMWKVGFTAFRLGLAAYLVPYMFVYDQSLLMMGEPLRIVLSIITATIGVFCLAGSVEGWLGKPLSVPLRVLLSISAFVLVVPGWFTDAIGLVGLALVFVLIRMGIGAKKAGQRASV